MHFTFQWRGDAHVHQQDKKVCTLSICLYNAELNGTLSPDRNFRTLLDFQDGLTLIHCESGKALIILFQEAWQYLELIPHDLSILLCLDLAIRILGSCNAELLWMVFQPSPLHYLKHANTQLIKTKFKRKSKLVNIHTVSNGWSLQVLHHKN